MWNNWNDYISKKHLFSVIFWMYILILSETLPYFSVTYILSTHTCTLMHSKINGTNDKCLILYQTQFLLFTSLCHVSWQYLSTQVWPGNVYYPDYTKSSTSDWWIQETTYFKNNHLDIASLWIVSRHATISFWVTPELLQNISSDII